MRLYLDEDIASRELVRALAKAGHDIMTPLGVDLMGRSDTVQMAHAVSDKRICLTMNAHDFEDLHDLIIVCQGSHPGIFTVRSDNDRRRDMKPGHVVTAIKNVMDTISSVQNHLICLNEWR